MPKGQLRINGLDAYSEWGISLEDGGLSVLMTPAPLKPFVENKSRLHHGKSVIVNSVRTDERQMTLVLLMTQPTQALFMEKYDSFINEIQKGRADILTSFLDMEYHCIPVSCTQFSQVDMRIAKMSFRLDEYNPNERDGLKFDRIEASIKRGSNFTLHPSFFPVNSARTLSWSSSDTSVATVNNGVVSASSVKSGITTIMATYGEGRKASCKVTVI